MSEALRPIVKKLDIVQIQRKLMQETSKPIAEDLGLDHSKPHLNAPVQEISTEVKQDLVEFKRSLVGLIRDGYTQVMFTNKKYIKSENKLYYEIRIREEMMVIFIYLRDKVKHKVEYKWCSIHALVDGKKGSIADVNHFYQQFLVDLEANCVEMFDAS